MLVTTGSRQCYIQALINEWLKMPYVSCAGCGSLVTEINNIEPCCESPFLGTNAAHYKQFLAERRELTNSRMNVYGSNKDMSMRLGISMPDGLFQFLDGAFKKRGERLITEEHNVIWFAKNFPMFCVPEKL